MTKRIIAAIFALLIVYTVNGDVLRTDLEFNAQNIKIEESDDGAYFLSYDGLSNCLSKDRIPLPHKHLNISIPTYAKNVKVSTDLSSPVSISLPGRLAQVGDAEPCSSDTMADLTTEMPNTTGSDADGIYYFDGLLNGNERYLCVDITPFVYDIENAGTITLYENLALNVSYEIGDGKVRSKSLIPISRQTVNNDAALKSVRSFDASDGKRDVSHAASMYRYSGDIPGYEYTVITTKAMAPSFRRLVSLKKQKGLDAGVVAIEDILGMNAFKDGDVISGINDDAGKLRAYITYIYEHAGTKFVLLGGSADNVPFRYGSSGTRNTNTPHHLYKRSIPTDMYYSDLNSNWNHRKKSNDFGFESDSIDYMPEVYVGRLLCSKGEEVENFTDKLESYEFNPGDGDVSYLGIASGVFAETFHNEEKYIKPELDKFGVEYCNYYQQDIHNPKGKEVVAGFNKVNPGIVYLHGHGNPMGLETAGKEKVITYGINALDTEYKYLVPEEGNGLDNLNNANKYFIAYTISCTTMPYDNYGDSEGEYACTYNFGQSITNGNNYGAVAYLGNTREGYFYPSGSSNTLSSLLETNFWKILSDGNISIGEAEALSKSPLYGGLGPFSAHHLRLTHNLLGDPSLIPWIGVPKRYQATVNADGYIDLSEFYQNGCGGMSAAVYTLNGSSPRKYSIGDGSIKITLWNKCVCIFGDNFLPIFLPLRLQNIDLIGQEYLHCSELSIGKNLLSMWPNGNVTFMENSIYEFNVSSAVNLNKGTVLKEKSVVKISSKGDATVKDVTIEDGATLNIASNSCKLENVYLPINTQISIKR